MSLVLCPQIHLRILRSLLAEAGEQSCRLQTPTHCLKKHSLRSRSQNSHLYPFIQISRENLCVCVSVSKNGEYAKQKYDKLT